MAENPKILEAAAVTVLQKVLAAYGSQRDPINDSDLDNEQPISLNVYMTLGELRMARRFVFHQGARPADFDTKPRDLMREFDTAIGVIRDAR